MRKNHALLPLLALLSFGAYAKNASVPEILTWINQHLSTVSWDHYTSSYSLEFTGCKVTLTEVQDKLSIAYGPFSLNDVVLNKIEVSKPDSPNGSWVLFGFVHPVSRHLADSDDPKHADSGTATQLYIHVATQEMASRHAKAWHDAIMACGGRAVPENLY
jgi:hypothetical protein